MDKTIQTHVNRVKAGKFTKSEIGAFTKMIASARFENAPTLKSQARKEAISSLVETTLIHQDTIYIAPRQQSGPGHHARLMHFAKPCKITSEQTEMGREYLKRRYVKTSGQARKSVERELNATQFEIVKSVSRFEFVGVLLVLNSHDNSTVVEVLPIYRTYNRKGQFFDYAPLHWSAPVVAELNVAA